MECHKMRHLGLEHVNYSNHISKTSYSKLVILFSYCIICH